MIWFKYRTVIRFGGRTGALLLILKMFMPANETASLAKLVGGKAFV